MTERSSLPVRVENDSSGWGSASFVDYVLSLPSMETTFAEGSWAGLSVSIKRAEK